MNSFKSSVLLLLTVLTVVSCTSQSSDEAISQEVKNLMAFSKLYGYVKYFHPSDEAREINWNKLAIVGAKKVKKAENDQELKKILQQLFLPIARTITITDAEPDSGLFLNQYLNRIDEDTSNFKTVAWQHLGVDMENQSQGYASNRINRIDQDTASPNPLYKQHPHVGETAIRQLTTNLWSQVPLALYSDESQTLPKSPVSDLNRLKKGLEAVELDSASIDNKNVWLADIIIAWNELQHFYPHFEVIDVGWQKQLNTALKKTLGDDTPKDFFYYIP